MEASGPSSRGDYVNGFGDLEGEFWYGLENIHCLTTQEDVELRIELGNDSTPPYNACFHSNRTWLTLQKMELVLQQVPAGTLVAGIHTSLKFR